MKRKDFLKDTIAGVVGLFVIPSMIMNKETDDAPVIDDLTILYYYYSFVYCGYRIKVIQLTGDDILKGLFRCYVTKDNITDTFIVSKELYLDQQQFKDYCIYHWNRSQIVERFKVSPHVSK